MLSLAGSTLLIRALGPPDWASFSVAYYVVVFLDQSFGPRLLGRLIQAPEPPSLESLESAARLMQRVGVGCAVLFGAASYPIALLYGDVNLTYCLIAVGVCAYIYAVRSTSVALLERDLRYREVAVADVVDQLTFYALAVPAVLADLGLPGVAVALGVRGVLAAMLLRRWAPAPFLGRRVQPDLRQLLAFGIPSVSAGLVFLADGLIPFFVLRAEHATELAFTMTAVTIVGYAATAQIVVQRVGFPSLSLLQADAARFGAAAAQIISLGNYVIVSTVVPFAASGPLWLPVLLGDEWRPASLVMMCIGAGLIFNGFFSVLSPVFSSLGQPRRPLRLQILMTGSYLCLAVILVQRSYLLGAAVAWALSRAIGAAASIDALRRTMPESSWRREAIIALSAVAVMSLAGGLLYEHRPVPAGMVALVAGAVWFVVARDQSRMAWTAIRTSWRPSR